MSSTWQQRYYGEEKQNSITLKPFGQVKMMQVCLNYKGTDGQLNCTVDGDNLRKVAMESGVKHIVSLYDDFSTKFFPSKAEVIQVLVDQLQNCKPGDFFVFQYSGHGTHVDDQNGDEQDGQDEAFCLRTKDGQDELLIDDQVAEIVSKYLDPKVPALFIVDACHSGTIVDLKKKGLWKGRKIFSISGCQDTQLSNDTGKTGGEATIALIKALKGKSVYKRRKTHSASIQMVFNRMVDKMPEQWYNVEEEDEEEFENEWNEQDFEQGWQEMQEDQDVNDPHQEKGQFLNLSWNGGTDPIHVPFPF